MASSGSNIRRIDSLMHRGHPDDELEALRVEVEQLRTALVRRAVIDQAKGMLVERLGCTPDEAFRLLTLLSQRTNRKVHDIATEMVRDRAFVGPLPR